MERERKKGRRQSKPDTRRRSHRARRAKLRYVAHGDVDPARLETAIALGRNVSRFGQITGSVEFPQVYAKLLARDPISSIVNWWRPRIPATSPLYELTPEALSRRLYRFRAALDPDVFLPRLPHIEKHYRRGMRLDPLEELAGAVHLQKARIDRFVEVEEGFPVPMEQMRREVLTLSELLRQYRDTAIAVGELKGTIPGQPTIDARQVHLTVQPPDGSQRSVAELLEARPAAIPLVMEMFDQIEKLEGGGGGEPANVAAGDVGAGAPDASGEVRPVDVGD